jgi:putative endonuclease
MDTVLHKRAKGNKGEDIACKFIINEGFHILDRNYLKKWGELDIVAEKDKVIHFFEVKSVMGDFSKNYFDLHRPEDNVDSWKIKHLRRIIETYLEEKGGGLDTPFQFHVLCVFMNVNTHYAHVKWLKNMIL